MFCPQCGTQNDSSARFCASCGSSLAPVGTPPPSQPPPQAPVPSASTEKAKKASPARAGCLGCLGLIAVLVVLGIIGAMSGGRTDRSSRGTASSSDSSHRRPSNRTTITFTNGKRIPGVVVDETLYGIVSARETASIGGSEFSEPTHASGRFVILRLIATNESKKTREISLSSATLTDSAGNSYQTSSEGETALSMTGDREAEFLLSQIQPGLDKYIKVVFDVPPDRRTFTLHIPHSMFSGGEEGTLPVQV